MSDREEEEENDRNGEREGKGGGVIKHLLDSPICAKPSEARCDREEEERGIEWWWAKRKERRRHAAHVNKCQELFWGGA